MRQEQQRRAAIIRILVTIVIGIVLLVVGCKKAEEPKKAAHKDTGLEANYSAESNAISLDTVPYRPLQNRGLMRDLSLPDDSELVAKSEMLSVGVADTIVIKLPADTAKIIQMSGLQKRIDSLLAVNRMAQATIKTLRDSLTTTQGELISIQSEAVKKKPEAPDEGEVKRVQQLAKVVESMKPAAAAAMLDKLPPKTATQVIAKLKERTAGKVLAALPVIKASQIAIMLKSGEYQQEDAKAAPKTNKK